MAINFYPRLSSLPTAGSLFNTGPLALQGSTPTKVSATPYPNRSLMRFKDDFRQLSPLTSEGIQPDGRLLLIERGSTKAYLVPKEITATLNRDQIRAWVLAHQPNVNAFLLDSGKRLLAQSVLEVQDLSESAGGATRLDGSLFYARDLTGKGQFVLTPRGSSYSKVLKATNQTDATREAQSVLKNKQDLYEVELENSNPARLYRLPKPVEALGKINKFSGHMLYGTLMQAQELNKGSRYFLSSGIESSSSQSLHRLSSTRLENAKQESLQIIEKSDPARFAAAVGLRGRVQQSLESKGCSGSESFLERLYDFQGTDFTTAQGKKLFEELLTDLKSYAKAYAIRGDKAKLPIGLNLYDTQWPTDAAERNKMIKDLFSSTQALEGTVRLKDAFFGSDRKNVQISRELLSNKKLTVSSGRSHDECH